jgi:hypothetical protein
MTDEPEKAEASKEEPFMVESETVDAIRARAPLDAIILDLMLVDGRAVMTDMTPEEVREGIRERYEFDPYEIAQMPRRAPAEPPLLPFITGIYSSHEVAKAIACRLIDAGLPVLVERLPEAPPESKVMGTAEGDIVEGHKGPVWVVWTGYAETG